MSRLNGRPIPYITIGATTCIGQMQLFTFHGGTSGSGWERSSARITQKAVADPKRSSRKLDSWPASGHSAQAHHASTTDDMPRLPPLLLVEVLTPHRVKPSYRTRLLLGLDVPASAFTAGSGCGLQSFDRIECLTTQPLVIAKSAQRHKVFGVSKLP